jgi:hypothetical protein
VLPSRHHFALGHGRRSRCGERSALPWKADQTLLQSIISSVPLPAAPVRAARQVSLGKRTLSLEPNAGLLVRKAKKLRRYSESPVQNEPEPNPRSTKLKFDITLSLFRVLRRQRVCTLGTG